MRIRKLIGLLTLLSLVILSSMPVFAQAITEEFVAEKLAAVPQGFGAISVNDFAVLLLEEPPFLLDVREPAEESDGFIEGAVFIPLREVADNLRKLPADLDTPIVVYCKSGHRGAIGMTVLQMLGYTNVRNLAGGIVGWKAAGNAVVEAPAEAVDGEMPAVDPELVAEIDNYLKNVLPQGWGVVTVDNLALELIENPPFLLDVRENAEWEADGYIDGAVHVPLREVGFNLDLLPEKDTPIVVYCKSGHRGAIAMTALQILGYSNVRNLAGGINGWIGADYDVVGGQAAAPAEVKLPEGQVLDAAALEPVIFAEIVDIASKPGFGTITNDGLRQVMDKVFLLDVREDNEWANGHLKGAVHIPLRALAENLNLLPTDQAAPIVIYCAGGHRGAMAQMALELLGYTDVMNLRGGFNGWDGETTTEEVEPVVNAFPDVDADIWATVNAYLTGLPGFGVISVADFNTLLLESVNPPYLVDVREPNEYASGFIPGAVNMPTRAFTNHLTKLPADKSTPIIVYDSSGPRGATVMTGLQMLGYTDVRNLGGGSAGWAAAGYELVAE